MAKILLPKFNSTWGVHVNPRGVNYYKYVYDFESLDDKLFFVSKVLLNGLTIEKAFANLPDVKSMINTRNSPLNMSFNVKRTDYGAEPLDWFLGKDICILQLEDKYYFYAIKSIKWDSFDTFTYTAELDIFFTYGEQKIFNDKSDVFVKRAHYDRWIVGTSKQDLTPNLKMDSPAVSNENFQQQDLQYNLKTTANQNDFMYWDEFIKAYQPNWQILNDKAWRNNIKFRWIPFTNQNPTYWKTTSASPSAQPTQQFASEIKNFLTYNYGYFLTVNTSNNNLLQFTDETATLRNVKNVQLVMQNSSGEMINADDIYTILNTLFEKNLGNTPYTEQNNNALANAELQKNIPTMAVYDTWVIPECLWNMPNVITIKYDATSQVLQIILDMTQTSDFAYAIQTAESVYGVNEDKQLNMLNISDNKSDNYIYSANCKIDTVSYIKPPHTTPNKPVSYLNESKLLQAPYAYLSVYNFYSEMKYDLKLISQNWISNTILSFDIDIDMNLEIKNRAIYLHITSGYYAQGNVLQNNYNNQHGEYLPSYNYAYSDFLLNNNQSLQNTYNKLSYDQNYSVTTGVIAGILEELAGVALLFTGAGAVGGLGLIAGGVATGFEAGQKYGDYALEKQGIKAQYQDASMAPHTIEATVSSRVVSSQNNLYAPSYALKTVTPFVQQNIATLFIKTGYTWNILANYNSDNVQKNRYWYNYVELSSCFENIALQVTNEVKEIIEASFQKGITFYHVRKKKDGTLDYLDIKDYSKNNLEMSIYNAPDSKKE